MTVGGEWAIVSVSRVCCPGHMRLMQMLVVTGCTVVCRSTPLVMVVKEGPSGATH